MKPEYEDNLKASIESLENWLKGDDRTDLERKLIEILDKEPAGDGLVQRLDVLSDRRAFVERAEVIANRVRDEREKPSPTAKEWSKVEHGLKKYLHETDKLRRPGTEMYWLMTDVWAMGKTPERSFFELVEELEERIEKISSLQKSSSGSGRRFEYWQICLVEELESTFQRILSTEPKTTTDSLFTKVVQVFLPELLDSNAFTERRKIVSDIYEAKMERFH
jgi:hypothetical protein